MSLGVRLLNVNKENEHNLNLREKMTLIVVSGGERNANGR